MPEAARTRTSKIRVMIADDHTILREGLKKLVDEDPGMECVGEAPDGSSAIHAAQQIRPDVLLLDLAMPGLNGIATAKKVRTATPETRILILTVHDEEETVSNALRAGAAGYVLKDAPSEDLLDAIRRTHKGEVYLSPEVSKLVVDGRRAPRRGVRTVSQELTNREREVCRHLAAGRSVPDIATILGISRKTVDVHKTRLMKKLDIHNRAALVKYAIQNRLIHV
jgi:two-component system response regulator NreC